MRLFFSSIALALISLPASAQTKLKLPPSNVSPQTPLNQRERAIQLLNRFTFGPRPGEVEAVLEQGTDKWFAQQLDPDSIKDSAWEKRQADFPTATMTADQALLTFPNRSLVELVTDGKRPFPSDPLLASVYEVQVYRRLEERELKKKYEKSAPVEPTDAEKAAAKQQAQETAARIDGELFVLPKNQRMAALLKLPVEDRIAFVQNGNDQRNLLMNDFTPRERETIYGMQGGIGVSNQIYQELAQAKIDRAILTERQIQEVMTDFWFNHFNIYAGKDSDEWYTTSYERDVIRPHALGKFRDLLLATAESPAMMIYLDNWLSIGPESKANPPDPKNPAQVKAGHGARGLNENYGREVMELHTVGVNGGYTQADVTHLSAILTGWGVDRPDQAGPFKFDPNRHEPGTKEWFGYRIDDNGNASRIEAAQVKATKGPAGALGVVTPSTAAGAPIVRAEAPAVGAGPLPPGMAQGVTALTLLAASPKTAHFISYLLAQRFVADNPPPALVDRMAATYLSSDGDIKAVLRALVASPEFNSHKYFRNKVKTPVEFIASAFRTTGTDPQNPGALANVIRDMGMQMYWALPPTGYYLTADQWMNTTALVKRLNFADQLTHNRFSNQKFDAAHVLALGLLSEPAGGIPSMPVGYTASTAPPHSVAVADHLAPVNATAQTGADLALRVLESTLIGGDVSRQTNELIHKQMTAQPPTGPNDKLNLLTALVLGSPEFQLR